MEGRTPTLLSNPWLFGVEADPWLVLEALGWCCQTHGFLVLSARAEVWHQTGTLRESVSIHVDLYIAVCSQVPCSGCADKSVGCPAHHPASTSPLDARAHQCQDTPSLTTTHGGFSQWKLPNCVCRSSTNQFMYVSTRVYTHCRRYPLLEVAIEFKNCGFDSLWN